MLASVSDDEVALMETSCFLLGYSKKVNIL